MKGALWVWPVSKLVVLCDSMYLISKIMPEQNLVLCDNLDDDNIFLMLLIFMFHVI